jgi:hypothetical protein
MRQLQRLHLAQFSFADEAFAVGLAHCVTLEALHLENQQVCCSWDHVSLCI